MTTRRWLLSATLLLAGAACDSSEPLVLQSADGERELRYDCKQYQSAALSASDRDLIAYNVNVVTELLPEDRRPFAALSFTRALVAKDFSTLERLVVEQACGLQREGRYPAKKK